MSLRSEDGRFILTLEAKDERGDKILNAISEFQPGTSCRLDLEADILEHMLIDARLAANKAKKREQELRADVAS